MNDDSSKNQLSTFEILNKKLGKNAISHRTANHSVSKGSD
jgi:hypothetical protein